MKTIIKFLFTLLILFAFSCSQETMLDPTTTDLDESSINDVSAKASSKQTVDIVVPPTLGNFEVIGTSKLHRNKNGIKVNFKATGLNPGAYTIWWVIWNNPQDCAIPGQCNDGDFGQAVLVEVEVMYAGGHVVGNNGKGNFSAHLKAGDDTPESMNTAFGFPSVGGLRVGNTFDAEVHIVLRTHGPAVPGLVNDQISSYAGGCDTPFLIPPFTAYPNEIGQCANSVYFAHV